MTTVKQAKDLVATGTAEQIHREYLRLKHQMKCPSLSLSQFTRLSRVADHLWEELRKRGYNPEAKV